MFQLKAPVLDSYLEPGMGAHGPESNDQDHAAMQRVAKEAERLREVLEFLSLRMRTLDAEINSKGQKPPKSTRIVRKS
jgi:hypothetical protein